MLASALMNFVEMNEIAYTHICGVPYTAVPIATLLSNKKQKSILIHCKSNTSPESNKIIGNFQIGESCLIIEDIISNESSCLDTLNELRGKGKSSEILNLQVNCF